MSRLSVGLKGHRKNSIHSVFLSLRQNFWSRAVSRKTTVKKCQRERVSLFISRSLPPFSLFVFVVVGLIM